MKFLIRNKGKKTSAHIWLDEDTSCTMFSTGGLSSKNGYRVSESSEGRNVCTMCINNFNKLQKKTNPKT